MNDHANERAQYCCPICCNQLKLQQKQFVCSQNHSFDIAKQGYVNLLPVQFKKSKMPGDNKAMVQARRAFLSEGFYQPLASKMLEFYQQFGLQTGQILDAGCGEGFYTHQYSNGTNQVYGIDISKETIKIAAKTYANCSFSVGTLSHLPFADNQIDWINSVYAPLVEKEFYRVLKNGGYLLTVTPAEHHLTELKALIYQQAKAHDHHKNPINTLVLIKEFRLSYAMKLTKQSDILNLLSMTPFAFKTSDRLFREIEQLDQFNCQADFMIRLYQKNSLDD